MKNKNDFSKLEIIQRIDALKSEIDKLRPIKREDENRIMQKFRLDWNYNSNAIEGNSLTYGETRAFLMHGITAKGKPFKDYLDIRGHNEAIDYLVDFINNKEELTEAVIRELHKIILVEPYEVDALTPDGKPTRRRIEIGVYKKQPNHVKTQTGEIHYFASPEETSAKMEELINWYRKEKDNEDIHPLILASFFHHRFAAIHPFDDGNGRMARLLMNLILMQNHFTPAVIRQNDRENYYSVLSQADAREYLPFIEYIGEYLSHSMEIFIKGAKGEDIEEPDDLDKELELFKKELEGRNDVLKAKRNSDSELNVYYTSIKPLLTAFENKIGKFKSLFFESWFSITDNKNSSGFYSEEHRLANITYLLENVEALIKYDKYFKYQIIICHLNEFKAATNPFNVNIGLFFRFNKFSYQISFAVYESNPDTIFYANDEAIEFFFREISYEKFYHNILQKEEIYSILNQISKDLLALIKELSKNKNVT